MNQEGYVYVIKSPNTKRYYIGSTIDPTNRISEHNNGEVIATRRKGPWSFCLLQKYDDIKIARTIEIKIKKFKSRVILEKMISDEYVKLK